MRSDWRAAAVADVRSGDAAWRGLCLKRARTLLGVRAKHPSAIKAWEATPERERFEGDTHPPAGVPVFWRGGKFGHVAVSDGGGYCFSTDIKRRGRLDRVRISLIHARWGLEYLGWTATLNGEKVYDPALMVRTLRAGMRGPDVAALQRKLHVTADGVFGPVTERAVNKLKDRMGLTPDGHVGHRLRKALGLDG